MFRIGDNETKISVTTWNNAVKVHFRKFFQSKFDRKKFYPSKQGIALTLAEWKDLKTLISQVDEVIDCSEIMLKNDVEVETRPPYLRQFAVNENKINLQPFNNKAANEIVRPSGEAYHMYKKRKLSPQEQFDGNVNFTFPRSERQDENEDEHLQRINEGAVNEIVRLSEEGHRNNNIKRFRPEDHFDNNANFAIPFQN